MGWTFQRSTISEKFEIYVDSSIKLSVEVAKNVWKIHQAYLKSIWKGDERLWGPEIYRVWKIFTNFWLKFYLTFLVKQITFKSTSMQRVYFSILFKLVNKWTVAYNISPRPIDTSKLLWAFWCIRRLIRIFKIIFRKLFGQCYVTYDHEKFSW